MSFIDEVVSGRVTLPMVPDVVRRLVVALRHPQVSTGEVAELLECDPVLASRVLRMANSSFFGGRRSVATIADAVVVVGLRPLETLVVACGAYAAFADVPGVNLRHFWQSSLLTAAAARGLEQRLGDAPEVAYCAGLLQGVGHLILCQWRPEQAARSFSSLRSLWGKALAKREFETWQMHHARVSALWAQQLEMPPQVVTAIADSAPMHSDAVNRLGLVVQLACELAAQLDRQVKGAAGGTPIRDALDADLLRRLQAERYVQSDAFDHQIDALRDVPALDLA